MTIGGNGDGCLSLVLARNNLFPFGRAQLAEWLPIIGVLVAAFVAWKLLTGIIKLAVIGLLILGGAWFLLGGLA